MRKILCVLVVVVMTLAGPVGAFIGDIGDRSDIKDEPMSFKDTRWARPRPGNVLDPILETELSNAGPVDVLDVIVRFRHGIKDSDYELIHRNGLTAHRTFEFVDAVHVSGTKAALNRLSSSDRVQWMEFNEQLDYLMDDSTTTHRLKEDDRLPQSLRE